MGARVFVHHVLVPPQAGRRMAVGAGIVDIARNVKVALPDVHRNRGTAGDAFANGIGNALMRLQARRGGQHVTALPLARPIRWSAG
jgi:hypothetical protein